jgi:quercetin dioxygenase-like cupin family protein
MLAAAFALTLFAQEPAPPPPAPGPAVSIRRAGDAAGSIGVGEVGYLSPRGETSLGQILLVEAPGYRTPVHVHHRTDETFYVLSGRLSLWTDGRVHELEAGDYVHIPRGVPHAQGNRGEAPAHLLMTVSPGDFIGFFRAREVIVRTAPPGHPDYGPRMRALGAEFDIENLAGPPF